MTEPEAGLGLGEAFLRKEWLSSDLKEDHLGHLGDGGGVDRWERWKGGWRMFQEGTAHAEAFQ